MHQTTMTVRLSLTAVKQPLIQVIKKPMDLYTISKNVKAHKYKNKAEFQVDLDQIWENSFIYNPEVCLEEHLSIMADPRDMLFVLAPGF